MPDEIDKLHKVEDLKNRLFNKTYKTEIEHRDIIRHQDTSQVADSWHTSENDVFLGKKFFMKTSLFKKFFIFSLIFFVLAMGYAGYTFFTGGNTVSNANIDISVIGNTFTAGGEELPLQINITNKNSTPLELVDLVIEYPKSSAADATQETEHTRQSLGTIPGGAVRSENVKLTLFGEQGSARTVKISIEYRVEGSNSIFVKEKDFNVNINSTPVNLSVDGPTEISPNQEVTLNIKAELNADKPAPGMMVKVDYPAGFQFTSSTPDPSFNNNVWNLGDLAPGVERDIQIVGKMVDVFDGEDKTFRVSSGSQSTTDKSLIGVVFNSVDHTISVKKPLVEAKLFINGVYQHEYASDTKTPIQGQIEWVNNLDSKINDLTIVAKISGNAVNRKTINAQDGTYNSLANTITWDKNSKSEFAAVNPGSSGTVNFTISPLALYAGSAGLLADPTINVDVSISGKQAASGNVVNAVNNSESKTIRIISDVGFANKALHFSGPFTNTGLIPPKAEKETTYTVVWTLSNTANSISKAKVVSSLPSWVKFSGAISPAAEDISYNASTREVTWNIGGIPKGTGITGATREVAFKVSLAPSLSQVGSAPILTNEAVLTGHDDFANVDVRVSRPALNTSLSNDPAFPAGGDRVVE